MISRSTHCQAHQVITRTCQLLCPRTISLIPLLTSHLRKVASHVTHDSSTAAAAVDIIFTADVSVEPDKPLSPSPERGRRLLRKCFEYDIDFSFIYPERKNWVLLRSNKILFCAVTCPWIGQIWSKSL